MKPPTHCRRCLLTMQPGEALVSALVASEDFGGYLGQEGTTWSIGGPGRLVPCWKCPGCGYSVRRSNAPGDRVSDDI